METLQAGTNDNVDISNELRIEFVSVYDEKDDLVLAMNCSNG